MGGTSKEANEAFRALLEVLRRYIAWLEKLRTGHRPGTGPADCRGCAQCAVTWLLQLPARKRSRRLTTKAAAALVETHQHSQPCPARCGCLNCETTRAIDAYRKTKPLGGGKPLLVLGELCPGGHLLTEETLQVFVRQRRDGSGRKIIKRFCTICQELERPIRAKRAREQRRARRGERNPLLCRYGTHLKAPGDRECGECRRAAGVYRYQMNKETISAERKRKRKAARAARANGSVVVLSEARSHQQEAGAAQGPGAHQPTGDRRHREAAL